ncbi:YraN family protein [Frondihabitans sp. 4ASC-45]|uniref:YraN family protein n=1 Tax=Frondihabitans sp. 4ASC-45 TaxID=3111636 RepID=UPI003C1A9850
MTKKNTNQEVGALGEEAAAVHLAERGYRILDRNWRCPEGEVDIVAEDDDYVVVVEVKTRTGHAAGHPFEAVTPAKVQRLRRLALAWAHGNPRSGQRLRVDVVAVTLEADASTRPVIEHLENVA